MRYAYPVISKKIRSGEFGLQALIKNWLTFRNDALFHYNGIYNGLHFNFKFSDLKLKYSIFYCYHHEEKFTVHFNLNPQLVQKLVFTLFLKAQFGQK